MAVNRKSYVFVLFLTAFFVLSLICSEIKASEHPSYVPGEVLVKFKPGTSRARIQSAHSLRGSAETGSLYASRNSLVSRVKIREGLEVMEALSQYRLDPSVEHVQPNFIYRFFAPSDDPLFPELWGLHNTGQMVLDIEGEQDADIDAPEAWDLETGSSDVVIAVIDSGVAYDHPDLSDNIWANQGETSCTDNVDNDDNGYIDDCYGWDFYDDDNDPMDDDPRWHGTLVAGIIGAVGNNGIGVSGVNWHVSMMVLKIGGTGGFGDTFSIVNAINYAAQNDARVINASWGGYDSDIDQLLYDAIETAGNAGVLFVGATGEAGVNNDIVPIPSYPDGFDLQNIIAVAATDQNDDLAKIGVAGSTFSSDYGLHSVDVAAPGVNILSTIIDGYAYMDGTSAAAPFVTGLAGLLLSADPDLTVHELKQLILDGVDPKPGLADKMVAGGRINALNSLSLLVSAIGHSPTSFTFTAIEGGADPASQTLSIWNSGSWTLNWSVSDDAAWLSLDPTSGSSTGETDDVLISVDTTDLDAGTYDATITISATDAANTPLTVSVSLTVNTTAQPGDGGGGGCFMATCSLW